MFKNRERMLDKLIAQIEKMEGSEEKYNVLIFLESIRHDENMICNQKEFKSTLKGMGIATVSIGIGMAIGAFISK